MADLEHKTLPDAARHEPKGASTASANQVIKSNGSGATSFGFVDYTEVTNRPTAFIEQGVWDYNDLATASTPVAMTLAATNYDVPNDGAGPFTNTSYALASVGAVWSTSTNRFDFSNISLGSTVDIRIDIEVTTSGVNHIIEVDLELGSGGSTFTIPFIQTGPIKTATTIRLDRFSSIYIGSADVRDSPAKFVIQSDSTGDTFKVNGWYVRVLNNV